MLARVHEGVEGEILEFVLLHVEVDEHAVAFCRFKYGGRAGHEVLDRRLGGDRVEVRAQRGNLDRDIDAWNDTEVVFLETLGLLPGGRFADEVLDEIEVLRLVHVRFGVGNAGLAEQIDRERDAVLPELGEHRERIGRVGPRDEVAGHVLDLRGDGLGHHALGDAARFQSQIHEGRGLHARLGQVIDEMVVDHLGCRERWEGVNEPEQLDLEVVILHRPVHQLVLIELRGEQTGLVVFRDVEHRRTDLRDVFFAFG